MPSNARSIASLTISFGLVAIPVKLYSAAVSGERISFNLLRAKDGSRVKQQYVAVNDGKPVERAEMTKGYEFAKDQYVMFSAQELKALEEETTHSIDITEFVPIESIDPLYFAGTYFLAPDKGGDKPYSLLATALAAARQCAVGRWTSRGKEHIVIVRPMDGGLAMHQLYFKAEVRTIKELGIELTPVAAPELKLANQLIEQLAAKSFDPNEFVDEHRARVEAAIQRKVQGKEVTLAAAPESTGRANVVDLMEALKASIASGGSAQRRTKDVRDKQRKPPRQASAPGAAAKRSSHR
ncbi:MAG TPA: Ku protein [Steroidobacteraceae bacterium]|jgi:DNA end-binding protein Ku|nr:Ku protein [Steroidobacteraceae bacterium]